MISPSATGQRLSRLVSPKVNPPGRRPNGRSETPVLHAMSWGKLAAPRPPPPGRRWRDQAPTVPPWAPWAHIRPAEPLRESWGNTGGLR